MRYIHTIRRDDLPSELPLAGAGHEVAEIRVMISPRAGDRWAEVECLCGAISREGGPEDYLVLAKAAWAALCGAREPASA